MSTFWSTFYRRISVDNPSPLLKQMPTTIGFGVAVALALTISSIVVAQPVSLAGGSTVIVLATGLAFYFTKDGRETRWDLAVPILSLLGIALLRHATGGTTSLFSGLIILPVVWIAAEDGRRWIIVSVAGTSAALMLSHVLDWRLPQNEGEWLRGLFTPFVFGIAAAVINELSRQARVRAETNAALAQELEGLLEDARANEVRLKSQDRLMRSIWDAVTEQSVIGTDVTGLIDVWNPGAAVMLGSTEHETQYKRYITDFHLDEELENRARELDYPAGATVLNPGFSALVEAARLGRAEIREWTLVRHDGSQVSASIAVTPRLGDDGSTTGYLFVGTDVTQALEVSRLKDEFVGLISHELRTPLSSILGYLELMRDDEESPLSVEQLQYLGVAERNAHRLLRLVGDLLFTAQVTSGKFPLDLGPANLGEILGASIDTARPGAEAGEVELVLELPAEPLVVRADSLRIGQACDNLISNAIKFTPRGGTVTVSLTSTTDDALVTVRDTGLGIPAAELDQLYARFFRASTATRNAVPGVGLGLTITKAIVTAHEGELDVESEEGVGTAFIMSLPR